MNICFLTVKNPEDKKSWSGIFYHLYTSLKKYHQVEWIGQVSFTTWQKILMKPINIYNRLTNSHASTPNILFCKFYAKNVKDKLTCKNYDLIFAPVSSTLIAFLDTEVPIVYLSDTTFELMIDYYPEFTGLSKKNIRDGNTIDIRALQRTDKAIFGSHWARNSAIAYYKFPAENAFVFEFGANLLYEPKASDLTFSDMEVCNILFLGVNWERKGGDIAHKTYLKLKTMGFACTFTIIGCNPNINADDRNITIIPFIDKNDQKDFDELYKIFLHTHILLLPSRAECFGIVFSEASAFGVPSITTNTGGIPSAIENGVNGFLLDHSANENEYAEKIYSIFSDKNLFRKLRVSTRNTYENKLSWKIWIEKFNENIKIKS